MDDLTRVLKNAGVNKPLMESIKPSDDKLDSITPTPESQKDINEEAFEEYTTENYAKKLKEFMSVKEAAGVGVNAEHNTYPYTPDIKKGTLKKTGDQLGFDITDAGIPPKVSKDSIIKSKK